MARKLTGTVLGGLLLGAAIALSGCASLFGHDYSDEPDYKSGYSAGCGTGTGYVPGNSSTVIRDPDMWGSSKAYRAGWKAGFNACRTSTTNSPSSMDSMGRGRGVGPSGY